MNFFTTDRITESTTQIRDITGVFSYLVEGNQKACLIDCGTGTGDIKQFVESLTNLPIFLVLTHGHCDHAGGAAYFDDVYLSEADWDLVEYHASMDIKTDYVNYCSPDIYKKLTGDDFCPVRTNGYKPLQNGQIFDLGGIKLEAVAVPGHTQGMTCILNEKERWILFGDACNPSVFLWGEGSLSVEEYRESLCNLKKYEERYDTVLMSHGTTEVGKKVLDGMISVCDDIICGRADAQPFQFMEHSLKLAKVVNEQGERIDAGLGNIVYRPEKIFR